MKKTLLLAAFACATLSVAAEGLDPNPVVNGFNRNCDVVWFNKDGQGHIFTVDENSAYDYGGLYSFYDKDFNKVASIDINGAKFEYISEYLNAEGVGSNYDIYSYIFFTQALFNDDDDFEYLYVDNNSNTLQVRQVISGNTIASLSFASEVNVRTLINIAGNFYLLLCIGDEKGDNVYKIYRIDRNNSSAPLSLVLSQKVSGFPNPVSRGEAFNIDYKGTSQAVVTVVSLEGSVALTASAKPGQPVSIDTASLAPGVYVYTLVPAQGRMLNGKFIVK